jgi:hypothetical protein
VPPPPGEGERGSIAGSAPFHGDGGSVDCTVVQQHERLLWAAVAQISAAISKITTFQLTCIRAETTRAPPRESRHGSMNLESPSQSAFKQVVLHRRTWRGLDRGFCDKNSAPVVWLTAFQTLTRNGGDPRRWVDRSTILLLLPEQDVTASHFLE